MTSSHASARSSSCRAAATSLSFLDILADDNYTVALLHANTRHGDKMLDQDYAFIMRIRDGQIAELQEAWTEGSAWNEFWS